MGSDPKFVRQLLLLDGEAGLRRALPDDAILSCSLLYPASDYRQGQWNVRVKIWTSEGQPPIELTEPLDEFPSPTLVAQAMLVT